MPKTEAEFFGMIGDVVENVAPSEKGDKEYFFIGMNDLDRDMTLTWDDGSEVTLTRWERGQPNFRPKKKAMCGAVSPNRQWKLNDLACTSKRAFICQAGR